MCYATFFGAIKTSMPRITHPIVFPKSLGAKGWNGFISSLVVSVVCVSVSITFGNTQKQINI